MPADLNNVQVELTKRIGKGLHLAVAVDGSSVSDRATSLAASFTNTKRGDKLQIFHISDGTKEYLTPHLRPAHLKHYYEDLAAQRHVSAEWICREKEEGLSTCMSVTKLSDKNAIDILFLGSFGRKGEKLDMLGTVSDYSLRESHSGTAIVRSTSSNIERQATFLVAVDGSHASKIAFCVVACWLKRPMDIVNVIMVTTSDGTNEQVIMNHYKAFMTEHKIAGKAVVKCIDRLVASVPVGILDSVKETGSDILVVGISGYGKKKLGSVSEDTITQASCTTIVIKDGLDINTHRFSGAGAKSLALEMFA